MSFTTAASLRYPFQGRLRCGGDGDERSETDCRGQFANWPRNDRYRYASAFIRSKQQASFVIAMKRRRSSPLISQPFGLTASPRGSQPCGGRGTKDGGTKNGIAQRRAPLPSPGGRCPEGADEGRPRSGRWRGAPGKRICFVHRGGFTRDDCEERSDVAIRYPRPSAAERVMGKSAFRQGSALFFDIFTPAASAVGPWGPPGPGRGRRGARPYPRRPGTG